MAKSAFTINAEYYAVRFFCGLINALPYAAALAFARGLGWLMFNVFRFKRSRTLFSGNTPWMRARVRLRLNRKTANISHPSPRAKESAAA